MNTANKSKEPSTRSEPVRKRTEQRARRKTLEDLQSRLEIIRGQDEDYVYRWVFDTDDNGQRLFTLQERGYEFASAKDHTVASAHTFDTDEYGSIIRKPDGRSGGYNYLMRIRKEFWEEDQAVKQKRANEAVQDIYDRHEDEDRAGKDTDVYSKDMDISLKR